jgi:hypothetical protein
LLNSRGGPPRITEKSDLDALFAFVMTYARAWLEREPQQLVPFGATMGNDGTCAHLLVSPELQDPRPLREVLTEGVREMAATGSIRAAALCLEVVVAPPGESKFDAIMTSIEHGRGLALQVVVPIKRTTTGDVTYADARASKGVPNALFPARRLQ